MYSGSLLSGSGSDPRRLESPLPWPWHLRLCDQHHQNRGGGGVMLPPFHVREPPSTSQQQVRHTRKRGTRTLARGPAPRLEGLRAELEAGGRCRKRPRRSQGARACHAAEESPLEVERWTWRCVRVFCVCALCVCLVCACVCVCLEYVRVCANRCVSACRSVGGGGGGSGKV